MKDSTGSDNERKRQFLEVFRRWEALFKRADRGDVQAEKWLIAEYFKSLGHLNAHGLDLLTEALKAKNTFFPTVKECLDIVNIPQISANYASPFYRPRIAVTHDRAMIGSTARDQRFIGSDAA